MALGELVTEKARFELHALRLGKLIGNILSLEMGARMAIVRFDHHAAIRVTSQLPPVKMGDWLEVNAFTNADDLTQTLEKFNKRVPIECRVDVSPITRLRDALAHGRMFGAGPVNCLRLLKFSTQQTDGKVEVILAEDMNDEWFAANNDMLVAALDKVSKALDFEEREFH